MTRIPPSDVVLSATELLYERFGETLRLTDPVLLPGDSQATVVRVRLAPNRVVSGRTLILKQLPAPREDDLEDNLAAEWDADFLREIVSYQFTTALPAQLRPGAQLLAHSLPQRMLILSDLGEGRTFGEILDSEDDGFRRRGLMAFAQALGRLHAATAERADDYAALVARAKAKHHVAPDMDVDRRILSGVDEAVARLEAAGLPCDFDHPQVAPAVATMVREARMLLTDPTLEAYTPFDLSPSNIHVSRDVRFLDFEWAGFRDATIDVAAVVAGFPLELNTHGVDRDEADAIIDAWISEIRTTWPNHAHQSMIRPHLVPAFVLWALLATSWFTDADAEHGVAGVYSPAERQGIAATWRYVASYAEDVDEVEVAAWARTCADVIASAS